MNKLELFLNRTSFINVSGNWQFNGEMTPERAFKIFEELHNNSNLTLLNEYTEFLIKNSYCDTDVYSESPTAIDDFMSGKSSEFFTSPKAPTKH